MLAPLVSPLASIPHWAVGSPRCHTVQTAAASILWPATKCSVGHHHTSLPLQAYFFSGRQRPGPRSPSIELPRWRGHLMTPSARPGRAHSQRGNHQWEVTEGRGQGERVRGQRNWRGPLDVGQLLSLMLSAWTILGSAFEPALNSSSVSFSSLSLSIESKILSTRCELFSSSIG